MRSSVSGVRPAASSTGMPSRVVACVVVLSVWGVDGFRAAAPRAARLSSLRSSQQEEKPDVIDEFFPRFRRDNVVDAAPAEDAEAGGSARMNTINDKLLADIEAAKGQFRVEAPQVDDREEVDVSDVNPVQSVLSGAAALASAYVFWLGVGFASDAFDAHPIDSEFYPVMRISMVMRTIVLGAGTLLSGITGFAGVGLVVLGAKVALFPDDAAAPADAEAAPPPGDDADVRD